MYAALIVSSITLLATSVVAAPANTAPPFEITNTSINAVDGGNTTLRFTVYDPDPLTNATQVCTGSWKTASSDYPAGPYETCGNGSFAWTMSAYTNLSSFVLGIEHAYEDPALGEPPYDRITNFGKANVTAADVSCTAGRSSCQQLRNSTIMAPITQSIA